MPLTAGKTLGRAVRWGWFESKGGDAMLVATFEIKDSDGKAEYRQKYLTFGDKARAMSLKAIVAMGFKGTKLNEIKNNTDGKSPESALDREVELTLVEEPALDANKNPTGATQVKISFIDPIGGSVMSTPLSLEKLNGLSAMMGDLVAGDLAKIRAGERLQAPKNGHGAAPALAIPDLVMPAADEDIPF